jgi:hypothetical protein
MGEILEGADAPTATDRHHRLLSERSAQKPRLVLVFREALARHHADDKKRRENDELNSELKKQGLPTRSVYPSNLNTQKANFAEIVLAEYLVESEAVSLPVYRLRHNQNIGQSPKGDDVLAFDLDSKPMRILVGESKFRQEPNAQDVRDIAECLLRSHREMIPVSLQFVVSQLNLRKETALARKVLDCQLALVRGEVEVNYVGLLLGNMSAANCVHKHTPDGDPKRMAMISLGIDDPTTLLGECYNELK